MYALQIADLNAKLEASQKEVDKQRLLAKALEESVRAAIGDNNFQRYLIEVFKKRMKRKKKLNDTGSLRWIFLSVAIKTNAMS